jgi:Domain of unknown function (DUF4276)
VKSQQDRVIDIYGDGKADVGAFEQPHRPNLGIVSLFTFRLCGAPASMLVRRRKPPYAIRGKRWRKLQQMKAIAIQGRADALVYVEDTEGGDPAFHLQELRKGRDASRTDFPTAVGVAHPCIEAWLLADGDAIRKAFSLDSEPQLPQTPEAISGAPRKFPGTFYKRSLAMCAGAQRADLSAAEKSTIVKSITRLEKVRQRCPRFSEFAEEVELRIRPMFMPPLAAPSTPRGDST